MRSRFFAVTLLLATASTAAAQTAKSNKTPAKLLPPGVTVPTQGAGFLGGSDACTTPVPIAGQGQVPFDNTTATTGTQGQNEALCYSFGTSGLESDTWFCWTANATGCAKINTCNLTVGVDTRIAVYPGCGCPVDGTSIACNDDFCAMGFESTVTWSATNGTVYTIQLGSYPGTPGGSGVMDFTITPGGCSGPPSNDNCATPQVIAGQGTFAFDNSNATTGTQGQNEALCNSFGTTGVARDLWYAWTADCSGTATMTTCPAAANDTKMAVYPGSSCPLDGTSIQCNDDACGITSLQSEVQWSVASGATYMLQIGTFPGTGGAATSFDIDITPCSGVSTPICFGDGSGTTCPCGNAGGPGEGCANGSGGGCTLSTSGTNSIALDDLVLHATNAVPNQPGLFFQGNLAINGGNGILFGDGLRCCGTNVVRLQVRVPDVNGDASTTIDIADKGGVSAGDQRCYQFWYRDPQGSACGSLFNLSSASTVTWFP